MRALKKYAAKRFKRLQRLLKTASRSEDAELFHQIRLEVKKIKALLGLFQFEDSRFKAHKIFIPIRTLFRKAGIIREPIVLRALVNQYALIEKIEIPVPSSLSFERFRKKIPDFIKDLELSERKISKQIDRIDSKVLQKYIQKQRKGLSKKLYPDIKLSDLHRSRKRIKEILYLSGVLKKDHESLSPFFNETAERIGQWHDKQVLIQLLIKSNIRNEETIHRLQEGCINDLKNLRSHVSDFYMSQL